MSALIPYDFSAPVPAVTNKRRENSINNDVVMGQAGFPVLSIKGKVFTLVKDNERKVLTRIIDDEEVPIASLPLAVVRANSKARVFYGKSYVEGESEGQKPMCFSHDGVAPDASSEEKQANKCQVCPHAAWGSKVSSDGQGGKGTACTVNTRLAVVDPSYPTTPFLLRVPAGSRVNFSDAVKIADAHGKDYNQVVFQVGFDKEAPSPKLTFRPKGILADDVAGKVSDLWEDPVVLDIVGVPRPATDAPALETKAPAKAAPNEVDEDELAAALQAKEAAAKAKASAKAKPAAKPAPVDDDELEGALGGAVEAEKPAAKPKPAAKAKPAASDDEGGVDDLLGGLQSLLGAKDD